MAQKEFVARHGVLANNFLRVSNSSVNNLIITPDQFSLADVTINQNEIKVGNATVFSVINSSSILVQGANLNADTLGGQLPASFANSSVSISAAGLATGGGNLTTSRTITVTKSSQAQANAGSDDTTAMTPLRVKDAITTFAANLTHTHTFDSLTSKPTTLSGYGITDGANSTHVHTFDSLTSKPTTLSGYGITDGANSTHVHTFASITSKPTTLSGYGITDAYTQAQVSSIAANKADYIITVTGSGLATGGGNLSANRVINVPKATAATYRAGTNGTDALCTDQVYAAAALVALTDAATITVNLDLGFNFQATIAGDRTLGAPSNTRSGKTGIIWAYASGAQRILTLHANYLLSEGLETGPYTIGSGKWLGICYYCLNTSMVVTGILRVG